MKEREGASTAARPVWPRSVGPGGVPRDLPRRLPGMPFPEHADLGWIHWAAGSPGHPAAPEEQSGSRRPVGGSLPKPHFAPRQLPLFNPPSLLFGWFLCIIGSLFLIRDDCRRRCCMVWNRAMLCAHCIREKTRKSSIRSCKEKAATKQVQ